jgi:DNA repair exonuclease SbcCD ATPase subunit
MLVRDSLSGKIISYTPESEVENKGSVEVAVLDGRYILNDFSRIIDTRFKSLPDAISAEESVYEKMMNFQNRSLIPGEYEKLTGKPLPDGLGVEQIRELAKKEFLTNINNLTASDGNTIGGLQNRISELTNELARKDSIISDQLQTISNFDDVLSSVSAERANALSQAEKQREAKVSLQQQADETLFRTELEVIKQREESARAAEELKESLLAVADQRDEITGLQTDIAVTNAAITGLSSDIGDIKGDISGINTQISETNNTIKDVEGKADDAIEQADGARNDANTSLFKINEANTKALRDVEDTDTAKQAIDKIFPI